MSDNQDVRQALERFFQSFVSNLIIDPQFTFTITGIDKLERRTATSDNSELVWVVKLETNSRAKLLGQFPPLEPGDYRGFYENLLTGRAMQFLFSEFGRQDHVAVDVHSTVPVTEEKATFTRDIPLSTAREAGIITPDSALYQKMVDYEITMLRLEGGSFISGPILDTIRATEEALRCIEPSTLFDCFSGVGTVSAVASARGVEHCVALDRETSSIERQFSDIYRNINTVSADIFKYSPTHSFDLLVADPYYTHVEKFLREIFPKFSQRINYALLGLGYVNDNAWAARMREIIDDYVASTREIDTDRHYWILVETI